MHKTPPPKFSLIALSVMAMFAGTAFAQTTEEKAADKKADKPLPQVEVVGTSPLPGIGIEKDKLPYDVQTVNSEQLYQSQTLNLTDYMSRNLLGVNINEVQGSPFQADITYRGFRLSGILGSSQGMSVYLDGVRVNEPFGDVVNWDMIPEAAIGNVTLVPGSNPVYGLNTLGGALAFTTKSGLTAPGGEVKLQAGSFGRVRADVSQGSKGADGYHSFIAATGFREDGWRDHSKGNLGNVFAKIGRQQNDSNWDVSLLAGRSNLLGNGLLPSHNFGPEGEDFPPSPGMYETNRRWVYTHPDRTRNELQQLTFNFQRLLDGSTELAANAYVRNSKRRTVGGDAEREGTGPYENEGAFNYTNTSQTSVGSSVNLTKLLGAHQLTTGAAVDLSKSRYGSSQAGECEIDASRAPYDCEPAADHARMTGKSTAFGIYASDTWNMTDKMFLTTSGRFNHSVVANRLSTFLDNQGNQISPARQTGDRFSYHSFNPSIGITYKPVETISWFANLGQSNRVPTSIELGCADPQYPCRLPTGLQADPYLKQVIARTIETGFRWAMSSDTGMNASIYRSDNKDDILFRFTPNNGQGAGYFDNFSRTRRQGIDIAGYTRIGQVAMRASYSYLHATYQAEGELFGGEREIDVERGTKIAGLPQHTFKLNTDWRASEKLTIGGTVIGTSSMVTQGNEDGKTGEDDDAVYNAKVKGYQLLNLHANYEAQKGLDYFARINNVFDTRFETYGLMAMSAFNAAGSPLASTDPGTVNRFVAPGAPRHLMIGVRYRF